MIRKRFEDKVIVITGGGVGIGRSTALKLAEEGASLVINEINPDRLAATVADLQAMGCNVHGVCGDISKQETVDALFDKCMEEFGRVDIFVNNVGIMDNSDPVATVTDDMWYKIMEVNLNAYMRCARKVIPLMLEKGKGNIVTMASLCGLRGGMSGAAYTTSKWAVVGLSKNITAMYAKNGIRCNTVCPSMVDTFFGEGCVADPFGRKKILEGAGTIVRRAQPEEIADIICYLASDDSDVINGAAIVADAGWDAY